MPNGRAIERIQEHCPVVREQASTKLFSLPWRSLSSHSLSALEPVHVTPPEAASRNEVVVLSFYHISSLPSTTWCEPIQ